MEAVCAHSVEVALHSWPTPWMLSDSILIPANPCSVVSFSVNLIILNQSDGEMVERDGKFGRYISVEEGMGLEERMEPGWVLEVMQGQGSVFLSDRKLDDKHNF